MKALINKRPSGAQMSRQAMQRFMIRSEADKEWERLKLKRDNEIEAAINAYAATVLWALHVKYGFGAKRLRDVWETSIKCRCEFRMFYRGGEGYVENPTGANAEDFALFKALRDIGADIKAWEHETFEVNEKTGEVIFTREQAV